MGERVETVVIGAGQAGLSVSHFLSEAGLAHVVLERGDVANTWRTQRWDGFYLNTPKWTQRLPGYEYAGTEPEAFSSLDETISYLTGYAEKIRTRDLLQKIDDHIATYALDAPGPEPAAPVPERASPIEELDLRAAGISTILWSNGYRPDFGWIDLPLFDEQGWPRQRRGVTEVPGLYFVGLHWLHTRRSSLLFGVGDDAEHVVSRIVGRR